MKKLKSFLLRLQVWHIGVLFLAISIYLMVRDWNSFVANIGTELFSIGITILVIDRLVQNHERNSLKASLISQMRSEHNILATDAARRIRDEGWEDELEGIALYDANLDNADLHDFNLKNSNLNQAKFKNANLNGVILDGANISDTNLEGAMFHRAFLRGARMVSAIKTYILKDAEFVQSDLTGATFLGIFDGIVTESYHPHLSVAGRLEGSIMPNGQRYNGCYNLARDLNLAALGGYDANSPFAMAEFYDVPVDEYMQGQLWKTKYDDYLLSREAKARDLCTEQGWNWDEMSADERGRFLDIWYKEP